MTPEAAVLAALNARAATLPAGMPALVWRELSGTRPDEYILIDHLPNTSRRPMIGSTSQTLTGIYQLTLLRRRGEFEIVYREQAALISEHFMALPRPKADGLEVTVDSATVGQGRADEQTHWAIPVSVNYRVEA